MQLDLVRTIIGHGSQFFDAADRMAVTALAFPNIQRRAPITVAADTPILHVFQPVSKATLADTLRHPVDGIIVADEILLYLRHFDEPGIAGIVDERCAAAPAVRIAMLKYRRAEQQAARFQIPEHFLVRFFAEHTRPRGFFGHLALCVHKLHQRQAVFTSHIRIVLTESRRDMHDARAVRQRDVTVTYHIPALFLRLYECEQRLVFFIFQIASCIGLQHRISALAQYGIRQSLRQIIDGAVPVHAHLDITLIRVYAQCNIGRQRPGRGRPRKDVSVFILHLEFGDGGALLHVLVPLCHFMAGQRRPASRAIGHDFKALVKQALFPNVFQRPPLGFNVGVIISDIRVLHIRPKTNRVRKILPHALVFPNALLTPLDERLQAVFLDLFLAVQPQELFHLQLHRQAVRVPSCLTGHHAAFHRVITRDHILKGACFHMADMGFSVGCRRAVIKCICPAVSARVDALFEDLVVLPELLHSLFPLDKIQICGYLVIQHVKILLQQVCFFMKPHTTALTACVPAFETSFTVKYKKMPPSCEQDEDIASRTTYCSVPAYALSITVKNRHGLLAVQPAAPEGYSAKYYLHRASTLPGSLWLLHGAYCLHQRLFPCTFYI